MDLESREGLGIVKRFGEFGYVCFDYGNVVVFCVGEDLFDDWIYGDLGVEFCVGEWICFWLGVVELEVLEIGGGMTAV